MYRYSIILITLLFLTGCIGTSSFEGKIYDIEEHRLRVDCSDLVEQAGNDQAYACTVEVTAATLLRDKHGKRLVLTDFPSNATVRVVLAERRIIGASTGSRNVEVAEVILLHH